ALCLVSTVMVVVLATPLAWHFQRIAVAGPVANAVVVPLLGVATPLGLGGLMTNRPEGLALAGLAADGMRLAAERSGAIGGDWRIPPPPGWLVGLALLSLVCWTAGLAKGGRYAWAG